MQKIYQPLVSIITVVYNNSKHIRDAIESVLSQDYSKIEYIVIDGGSTDGTLDIIEEYVNEISAFLSEPDEGVYDALNKGIAAANGDGAAYGDVAASGDGAADGDGAESGDGAGDGVAVIPADIFSSKSLMTSCVGVFSCRTRCRAVLTPVTLKQGP